MKKGIKKFIKVLTTPPTQNVKRPSNRKNIKRHKITKKPVVQPIVQSPVVQKKQVTISLEFLIFILFVVIIYLLLTLSE